MNEIRMAVYGTLRRGHYNHDRFPGGVTEVVEGARIPGALYVSGLPYLDAYAEDSVVCDILTYDADSDAYKSVCHMEIGAGYVPVMTRATKDGVVVDALVWHYPGAADRGNLVDSGDFHDYVPEPRYPRRTYFDPEVQALLDSEDEDDEDIEFDDEDDDWVRS